MHCPKCDCLYEPQCPCEERLDALRDHFAGLAMQTLLRQSLYTVQYSHDEGDPIETAVVVQFAPKNPGA